MSSDFVFSLEQRRKVIGKTLAPHRHQVTKESVWAYALATNDPNPFYERGELAPPIYAVVPELSAMFAALKDEEVIGDLSRFLRLLHGEHVMRFMLPLVPGETYETKASVHDVQDKGSGELLSLRLDTVRVRDQALCTRTVAGLFMRHPAPAQPTADKGAEKAKVAKTEPGPVLFTVDEPVALDQSLRYADASGDHNPIHKDPAVALKAGLPGIILHGLCTMAFVQKAAVNQCAGGDPRRLAALRLRFAKPVLPGQTVTITGSSLPKVGNVQHVGFKVTVGDTVVASDGLAEVA